MKTILAAALLALLATGCKSGCDGCRVGSDAEFPEVERWWK